MEPHDLYGLPLERFTEERNTLAKELRRAGRRDQAAEVAKLRKPSLAAWAVNQLARTQPRDMKALFKSGDALQKAQAELLAGRSDPASLRAAVEAERVAVDRLLDRARGLLSSDGHELSPAGLEQVSETLHAAALEEDARVQVSDGCLTRELRRAGLGGLAADSAPRGRAAPGRKTAPRQEMAPRRQAAPRQKAAPGERTAPPPRAAQRPKSPARAEARRVEADARRRLERAERVLARAEDRQRRAEGELADAQAALAAARQARAETAREHERTRAALKDS
jgi:hypothetical protein